MDGDLSIRCAYITLHLAPPCGGSCSPDRVSVRVAHRFNQVEVWCVQQLRPDNDYNEKHYNESGRLFWQYV